MTNQLVRSGTSVGANIREAFYVHGKAGFIARLHISLKECAEVNIGWNYCWRVDILTIKLFWNIAWRLVIYEHNRLYHGEYSINHPAEYVEYIGRL